jgi:uncharacterized protein YndB with AHSA1/START domain
VIGSSAGAQLAPVVKRITVKCGAADAFRYFTEDFAKWWPLETHSCIAMSTRHARRPRSCMFETRAGGRIIEFGDGDERHEWGTVIDWDPPSRVSFTWHPGRPAEAAQRVEVVFLPVPGGTDVVLTHSGWEQLAEEAARARESYDNGWESVFNGAYGGYVEKRV